MVLEGECGRCGVVYQFPDLSHTRHRKVIGNTVCNGLPKRIYEVHDDYSELQSALIKRRVYKKQQHPLLKFRPYNPPGWEPVDDIIVYEPTPPRLEEAVESIRRWMNRRRWGDEETIGPELD